MMLVISVLTLAVEPYYIYRAVFREKILEMYERFTVLSYEVFAIVAQWKWYHLFFQTKKRFGLFIGTTVTNAPVVVGLYKKLIKYKQLTSEKKV